MTLELTFLNVGNADCIVILPPEKHALIIDVPRSRHLYKWLVEHNINRIESIYITHGHRDHLPSLSQLVTFLDQWLVHGTLGSVYLPTEVIRKNVQLDSALKVHDEQKYRTYRHAIDRIEEWEQTRKITVCRSEHSATADSYGNVSIRALHPTPVYVESYSYQHPNQLNELSLVLRLEYGAFNALFTADIEGDGLCTMLSRCTDDDLHCHILKIPHHGAWHHDAEATESLFIRANPELAILSVGSTNTYNHVQPGLFRSLLHLQQTQRLQHFMCTEVTRTCVYTAQERADMKRTGLPSRQVCAGDIVIEANQSGTWTVCNLVAHQARVDTIERAACHGRADLDEYPVHPSQS